MTEWRNGGMTGGLCFSKNDVHKVLSLIRSGVSASSADYDRRAAVHLAAAEGHVDVLQVLVEEGADVNVTDRFGHTALDEAISGGHSSCVQFLRTVGAKHGAVSKIESQLITAAASNNTAEVLKLLEAGVSPNVCDYDKRTPLHLAVAENNVEIVRLLLKYRANPKAEDRWGLTPLADASRRAARTGTDPLLQAFEAYIPTQHGRFFSWFVACFVCWEVAMIILFGLFVHYGESADGNVDPSAGAEDMSRYYPLFQDVHVMIFIGFGFLMVFLRKHGYTSVGVNFLIGVFSLQWYQLVRGFWQGALSGNFRKFPINLETLISGDFSAGSVLISYGAVLGKVTPFQMMVTSIIEVALYALNEQISFHLSVPDLGGTMIIHMFGAYFGLALTKALSPKEAHGHHNNAASYHSDLFAMIGTIFLFMYWPSFNGALGLGNTQHRAVINTVLSLCASCMAAFLASHVLRKEGKFNMVDIQNATLAVGDVTDIDAHRHWLAADGLAVCCLSGGVAMGACADQIIEPASAMAIGTIAGFVSVVGYVYIQPWLEDSFGIHDTCGVNNLHGMPSLIGAFASVISASQATLSTYGPQLAFIYVARNPSGDAMRSASAQAGMQVAFIFITLGIAIGGGTLTGLLLRCRMFGRPDAKELFLDSPYWEVPALETPYYFDHRGEISRGAADTTEVSSLDTNTGATVEPAQVAALRNVFQNRIDRLESQIRVLSQQVGPSPAATTVTTESRLEKLLEQVLLRVDTKRD